MVDGIIDLVKLKKKITWQQNNVHDSMLPQQTTWFDDLSMEWKN